MSPGIPQQAVRPEQRLALHIPQKDDEYAIRRDSNWPSNWKLGARQVLCVGSHPTPPKVEDIHNGACTQTRL